MDGVTAVSTEEETEHASASARNTTGSVAIIQESIRSALLDAYFAMGSANSFIQAALQHQKGSNAYNVGVTAASERIQKARPLVEFARDALRTFLQAEEPAG